MAVLEEYEEKRYEQAGNKKRFPLPFSVLTQRDLHLLVGLDFVDATQFTLQKQQIIFNDYLPPEPLKFSSIN